MGEASLHRVSTRPAPLLARAVEVTRLLQRLNASRRQGVDPEPLLLRATVAQAQELAERFARARRAQRRT